MLREASRVPRLRRRVAALLIVGAVATGLGFRLGARAVALPAVWFPVALGGLAVAWLFLDRRLQRRAARSGSSGALPTCLGVPTAVTVGRAVLIAWTAGFLALGAGWLARPGWFALPTATGATVLPWLPAVCFGAAATLDAVDGAVARALDAETEIGAELDADIDAFGLLVASLVGAVGGAIPAWYLVCGGARYAYVAGKRRRRRLGLPVHSLPPRASRRWLGGLQMAFVAVALTPAVGIAAARVGAAVFGSALLCGFARDWAYVSGRLDPAAGADVDADPSTERDAR